MKNFIFPLIFSCLLLSIPVLAQRHHQESVPLTNVNDVYAGYGVYSIYMFTQQNNTPMGELGYEKKSLVNSAGTFLAGYSRTFNRVLSFGFQASYMNVYWEGTGYSDNEATSKHNDAVLSGIVKLSFCYVNKPSFRMYSGFGIGISVINSTATLNGNSYYDRKLRPAGQLTLMGVRAGRKLGGFGEFGFGTNGIINAGMFYRFGD
ncbi:MAG: hypothetical protein NTX61_17110 [Bacteroidetes bacterium]|nr:hypothetical protein [Bacteroidota bacterium]